MCHSALAQLYLSVHGGGTDPIELEVSSQDTTSWSDSVARSSLTAQLVTRSMMTVEAKSWSSTDIP